MNQRDTALASLRDRTHRAAVTRDPNLLLDEIALSDARRLVAVVDPETDIPAAHALGWFCWLRYLVLSGENAEEELQAALALFKPVFDRNPYAVPTALQRWYLQPRRIFMPIATGRHPVVRRACPSSMRQFVPPSNRLRRRSQTEVSSCWMRHSCCVVLPDAVSTKPSWLRRLNLRWQQWERARRLSRRNVTPADRSQLKPSWSPPKGNRCPRHSLRLGGP